MHIILFILLIIGFIVILGLSVVGSILKSIFGLGRHPHTTYSDEPRSTYRSESSSGNGGKSSFKETNVHKHKKIFGQDEGEYVDFEEVK